MRKVVIVSGVLLVVLVASTSTGKKEPEELIRIKTSIRKTEETLSKIDSLSIIIEENIALIERDREHTGTKE